VNLPTYNSKNLTIDCRYVPPPDCTLTIDKKCVVEPTPPGPYTCAKPIDSITMIWIGECSITPTTPDPTHNPPQVFTPIGGSVDIKA